MKLVYSNENIFIVSNIKNIVEAQGISVIIKNEFSQGAVGEVSATDSWPEVWILNDADFDRAEEIIESALSGIKGEDWSCKNCSEKNDPSFEVCWNCQSES